MTTDRVAAIVKTVLYEGYALYPYRPSALKNQKRFAFGAVYPRAWATLAREPFTMRAECVIEAPAETEVEITVGFLVLHRGGGGTEHALRIARRTLAPIEWRESRRVDARTSDCDSGRPQLMSPSPREFEQMFEPRVRTNVRTIPNTGDSIVASGSDHQPVAHAAGSLSILVDGSIVDAGSGLWRIALELENVTPIEADADREAAMDITLASTHVLMRAVGGVAISTTDPPPHAADAVAACRTLGCYPVVVARDTVLASPIVLADFPEIADQSPGDFFDGTEMDEMLTLRVLTLTDDEKREAAAADPRIAALLKRTEDRGIGETARLHGVTTLDGTIRSGAPVDATHFGAIDVGANDANAAGGATRGSANYSGVKSGGANHSGVTRGGAPNGDATNGRATRGDVGATRDGATNGDATNGGVTRGGATNGNAPNGGATRGGATNGDAPNGRATRGDVGVTRGGATGSGATGVATRVLPRAGDRVRLRPHGRADAFDIILAGKLATVASVERDLEGRAHVAVTIDDDPGADLGAQGMPGHRFYFRSDELEPVADLPPTRLA